MKAESDDKDPLAKYHTYRRHFFFFRMSKHAYLEIKPEIVEVLDNVICQFLSILETSYVHIYNICTVTYLIVERRRRDTIFRLKYP